MKVGIIQFPGSNCERETLLAVERVGMKGVEFLWNESLSQLSTLDAYIIVGGFSYEDRSRAGIIAALDPVMKAIAEESEKGKAVLGICNGAQILVETGLVPGLKNNQLGMALAGNKRMKDGKILGTGFYNAWVHLRLNPAVKTNAFTRYLKPSSILSLPIAHGEGRFLLPSELFTEIEALGLAAFQYCDSMGQIIDEFPVNPNGSLHNLAAVTNLAGNVMAMMPHPERTPNGDALFASMRDYHLAQHHRPSSAHLAYSPKHVQPFYQRTAHHEWMVESLITDNQALTVQNTLRQLGFQVQVLRRVYWELDCNSSTLDKIKATGLLYNERKEVLVTEPSVQAKETLRFLVKSKEDLIGHEKLQLLKDHFNIQEVESILHGILWIFNGEKHTIRALKDAILTTNIISNPYAHDCYEYA